MGDKYVKKVFYSTSSIQNGRTFNSIITLDKVQKTGKKNTISGEQISLKIVQPQRLTSLYFYFTL